MAVPTDHLRTVLSSTWALGGLVFVLTWGGGAVAPEPASLDASSFAGLNMALQQGLDHGREIIWPFGPLGFLKSYYVFYEWPARLATLYGAAIHLGLSLSLVWAARRSFPLVVALALALVAAMLLRGDLSAAAVRLDAGVVVLVFIWCVAVLRGDAPRRALPLLVYGGGALAAIEALAKLNVGIIVAGLVAVTILALGRDRWRNLAGFAVTFLAVASALWLAAGQTVSNIDDYLLGWSELASGFSTGARLEFEERDYDYYLVPAALVAAAALGWLSTRDMPPLRRAAVLVLVAGICFYAVKDGLVSHDVFHMATSYSILLGACIALSPPRPQWLRYGSLAAIAGVAAAALSTNFSGYPLADPIENVRHGAATLRTMIQPGRLADQVAGNRAALVDSYGLDDRTLAALDGRTVHVHPSEAAAAWAYELDWRPLPVFEAYSAWTERLDRENAEALSSESGPEVILRLPSSPLGRWPGFESPLAMIEMFCNFRAVRTTDAWQVLERTPDRCGEPQPLGTAEAVYGEPIPVPAAPRGSAVVARVNGVEVSGLERLRALFVRALGRQVSFDDNGFYVFIPATAADGLLLHAPARADYPTPFTLAPNPGEMTFYLDNAAADDPISVEFLSLPIEPFRGAR